MQHLRLALLFLASCASTSTDPLAAPPPLPADYERVWQLAVHGYELATGAMVDRVTAAAIRSRIRVSLVDEIPTCDEGSGPYWGCTRALGYYYDVELVEQDCVVLSSWGHEILHVLHNEFDGGVDRWHTDKRLFDRENPGGGAAEWAIMAAGVHEGLCERR